MDPLDPALDVLCVACAKGLHGACLGWWAWCPCDCGLLDDDPRTSPISNDGGPHG